MEIEWVTLIGALCLLWPRTLVFVRERLPVGPFAENELKTKATSASEGGLGLFVSAPFRVIDEALTRALNRITRLFALSRGKPKDEPRPTSGQFLSNWETWRRDWREKRSKSIGFALFNLLRGALGTILLLMAIHSAPPEAKGVMAVVILQFGILAIGVLFQLIQYRKAIVFISPTFYLSGITVAWSGWEAGGFAVLAGFVFALALRELRVLIPVMGLALVICGYIAYGVSWPLIGNVSLFLVVILLTLLTGRRLTFYVAPR